MTVINMLSVEDGGIAVADEQSSGGLRQYEMSEKLKLIGGNIVYGGSGPEDMINTIYEDACSIYDEEGRNQDINLKNTFGIVSNSLNQEIYRLKNSVLNSRMSISLANLISGKLDNGEPLDESTKQTARNYLGELEKQINSSILLGGIDSGEFGIYLINSGGTSRKVSRPYNTIGTGSDQSDSVLSNYVHSHPRRDRENIDFEEGLVKILEATMSSIESNRGVGGTPSIIYLNEEGVNQPGENECKLATEMIKGLNREQLDRDFVYETAAKLVRNEVGFEETEEEMKRKAKDWEEFDRVLRGYKE